MTKQEVVELCLLKQNELIDKYFGNLVHEAAIERPETIGNYSPDLPKAIEAEYSDYLKSLWAEFNTDPSIRFEDIINKRHISELATQDDIEGVKHAYDDAKRITLWERLTKSNHEDVTFYKGLLKEYAKELLNCLRCDFIEDVKKM